MWQTDRPWWEFVVRAAVVYFFLLVTLRLTGKRQTGELSPFDLVLLLILSDAVQNSMNANDESITGGLILASTLLALNYFMGWLTFRSRRMEAIIEGSPIIVIHDGKINHAALASINMTIHELHEALRNNGCTGPSSVRFAVVENTGKVSVIPMEKNQSSGGEQNQPEASH